MCNHDQTPECASWHRMSRRRALGMGSALASLSWLTPLAEQLARAAEKNPSGKRPKSLLMLWLQGGPSQLETFDPHPGTRIGGQVKAISTSANGVQIADTMPLTAEQMKHTVLIRSMVSKEGDHERATYNVKTGWRPDPTLIHPSIGSVICHQTKDNIEIPRHVSILVTEWFPRGGYLGSEYDAFQIGDPRDPLPNLKSYLPEERQKKRLHGLTSVVEREFERGRIRDLDREKTLHETSTTRAVRMMESKQIEAFDVTKESSTLLAKFGDTRFGRGCLAAIRLIETGVRCVEVELNGWDSHINNHELQSGNCKILDAALAATLAELENRGLLDDTLVFCGGEFGRTPTINPAGGRDHWPTGFSALLAGSGLRRGIVHGETSPDPDESTDKRLESVASPVKVEDLHATMLTALEIDPTVELQTPIGRPLTLSQGNVLKELMKS
jgi:Protein of unknown function (DUF1501)